MTIDEAIKELEDEKALYNTDCKGNLLDPILLEGTPDERLIIAIDIATEALKNQQKVVDYLEAQLKDAKAGELSIDEYYNNYCGGKVEICEETLKYIKGGTDGNLC